MKRTIGGLAAFLALAAGGAWGVDKSEDGSKAAVARGNNAFAFDLYSRLRETDGNLFLSPYSISTALAMTYAGARGETAGEMAKVLHFPGGDSLHPDFAALVREINAPRKGYQLSTANALWGQKGYPFRPEFLKLVKDEYGGGLEELDFADAERARRRINGWVEEQTHDKIKDLIAQGVLNKDTALVLTNAIYFKGDWQNQFKKDATHDGPFHLAAGEDAKVPLMHQKARFGYADLGDFQALELPYVGKELAMVVLLPKKVNRLTGLEKSLTADRVAGVVGKLGEQEVIVTLPRFKTTAQFELNKTLAAMGMQRAFSDKADFSGMTQSGERLAISNVIHKAFVEVNETGTEAAAATAVVVVRASAVVRPKPVPEFRADHPFVFLIRDTRNDSILFLGRVADPRK